MVKIISDSTCDLSQALIEKYDITILPLHILLGDKEYRDGADITPEEIFAWSDENKTTPKTSAPSLVEAVECLRSYVEAKTEVICFSISASMSTSGNVMRLAAEELEAGDLVTVIDSANLSTGIGHLVIEAALMAQEGKDAQTIAQTIEELKPRVRASFVVDTLTYLYKKYRGKLDKVILSYTKDMEEALKAAKPDRVFITHSGCDKATVDKVREYLKGLNHFNEIIETRAGGVISSHCGPGTLGVLFIAQ